MSILQTPSLAVNGTDYLTGPVGFKTDKKKPVDYFPTPNAAFDAIARELGPYAVTVYSYLLRHCTRETGKYQVDYFTVSVATRMSVSSVRRAVKVLCDAGFVAVEEIKKARGKKRDGSIRWQQLPNTYTVAAFPKEQRVRPTESTPVPTEQLTANNAIQEPKDQQQSVVDESIVSELQAAGVSAPVAAQLAASAAPETIRRQLDCLSDRAPKNPPAVLVKSIRENWAAPPKYLERKEREIRAENERAAQTDAARRKAAQMAAEREETARLEYEARQLDAMWETLATETKKRIEQQSIERLGVLGRTGTAPAALIAMRRNLMREQLQL